MLYTCIIGAVLFLGILVTQKNIFPGNTNITSPLPNFLTFIKNNQVLSLDLWFPYLTFDKRKSDNTIPPEISARSALVYDLTTSKILYEKNSKERLPMASITKIMTAIIGLENEKKDNEYLVTKENLVGENSMGLSEGEVLTLEELLYGLMLNSGNDAAETLASNYPQGRDKFIEAMNNKVRALGLSDTNFTNPTGLEGDGRQYTTAYDLLVITKYAMRFPLFRRIVAAFNHYIPKTETHKEYFLENETNLLTSYPGVFGVKTGYTPEAGLCLVTYLRYERHELIGIILGSDNRREEMKELLDYGLKIQNITPPPHS